MKTERVTIKEFKVLKNFEAEVKGNHILLCGDNGVGKSSFMQFIQIALGKTNNIPPGATGEGEVLVNRNGEQYKFYVKFKDGKPVVTVTGPDGMKDSRKGTIASIVGAMDFDVNEFVELSKSKAGQKKQVEIFKSFLPVDVREEIARFEANVAASYEERTELNKDIKKLEGSIALHPLNNLPDFELTKFVETNTGEVIELLKSANEHNAKVTKVESGLSERKITLKEKEAQIKLLKAQISQIEQEAATLNSEIVKAETWLAESKNKKQDVSGFERSISDAADNNAKYQKAQSLLNDRKKLHVLKSESGELSAKIESSREAIRNAVRADFDSPVNGLSFEDESLVYNGVPVSPDSLSTSEIIELGIRLKMAENPGLGMLFIEHGESLGSDRLKLIKDIADKAGWQIIMEQVERGNKQLHIEIMSDER